ncbi:DUF1697 domain-containing protein [Primorskyibacter sp. 2E107]|uniref:DUF1697 domain-containing protein n=1 Tax=Primorskyibacter sp. 2E107 TaxID=3403458 RepID=UPI003AF6BE84
MTRYCALLRAVNVGGTGKLPMADLRALCTQAGFTQVSTYIASGNALFTAHGDEPTIRAALETRLAAYAGKPVGVLLRSASEMAAALRANPWPDARPNQIGVLFLPDAPESDALAPRGLSTEEIIPLGRTVFIHYPDGIGRSKLKLAAMEQGTTRNLNTVAKLVDLLGGPTD